MAENAKIEVRGIRDLRRALRDVEKDAPKELRDGLADVAQIVVDEARSRVPTRSGDAAGSIRVRKQSAAAAIAMGGNKAPYYPWLDFGGRTGRGKRTVRPFIKEGRYIYPSLRDKRLQVNSALDNVLERLALKAGFETMGDATK